jgi:hypothetical protein
MHAATGAAVRLGQDQRDFMPRADEPGERAFSELWGARED